MKLIDIILGKEPRGAWFWLIAIITLLMLFAPRCAHAQFGVEQPFFGGQPAPFNLLSSLGATNWWVSSDLAFDQVDNWTDRLSGVILTNDHAGATQPTNSALGVYFAQDSSAIRYDASNYPSWIPATNATTLIIFRPVIGTDFDTLYYDSFNSGFRVRRFSAGNWRAGPAGTEATCFADPSLNIYHDILICRSNATTIWIYTNGIATAYFNKAETTSTRPTRLGAGTAANVGLEGYVTESIYFHTNLASISGAVSNAHYYATNKYLYSP